jgi:Spy/CpxP family protein refolding chaperone
VRPRRGRILAAAFLAVITAQAASAQQPGPPLRGRPAARDELFKMIDAYIVSNLQESLGLSDDQFVKLLPLVKRLQSDRRGFHQRRGQALQELRRLLRSGGATEPRVGELLDELKAVEVEEPATIRKDIEAIDAVLTPVQQAKYRVLEVEVDQKIREILAEARRRQGPRRDGPREPR